MTEIIGYFAELIEIQELTDTVILQVWFIVSGRKGNSLFSFLYKVTISGVYELTKHEVHKHSIQNWDIWII